jgi:predicted DNA-binding transcriptional regulator YafY
MSSYAMLANALKVHDLIFNYRRGKLTKPDIAKKLEISEKQVTKAIDFLKVMGYPAQYDEANERWHYDWSPEQPLTVLSDLTDKLLPRLKEFPESEFAVLLMLQHGLQMLYGTGLWGKAKQFVDLLNDDRLSVLREQVKDMFTYQTRSAQFIDSKCFAEVASAVYERQQITFMYQKPEDREPAERTVDPHHLIYSDEIWHVMGWDQMRNEVRTFSLTRMQGVQRTGAQFEPMPKAVFDEQLEHAFKMIGKGGKEPPYKVRLRFDAYSSAMVREKLWHTSQEITLLEDGCSEVSFEIASLTEIESWVMGWCNHCEVLEPPELVERVRQSALAILAKYDC